MTMALAALVVVAVGAGQPALVVPGARQPAASQDTAAIVRGRVVDGVTGRAVGRARIELNVGGTMRTTLATARGDFEFRDVPEGRGTLLAEKSGYRRAWFPDRRVDTVRFRLMEVRRGSAPLVTVTMFRKPAISGHVVDEYGDPVEGVQVRAWRLTPLGSRVTVLGSVSTNDIGEYRLNNLEPGRYIVGVLPSWFGKRDADREVPLYGISFYPGVLSLDLAEPIVVGPGQSVGPMDVPLAETAAASVEGLLLDPDGRPLSGGVTAFAVVPSLNIERKVAIGGGSAKRDGTFTLRLPPGEYEFRAFAGTIVPPKGWPYAAIVRATVAPSAVTRLTLTAARPSTLSGRVVWETGGSTPPKDLRITVTSSFDFSDECSAATEIKVAPDGTFDHGEVFGRCVIRVNDPWTLKSVVVSDAEMADRAIDFEPGRDVRGVRIVVTEVRTSILPDVRDENGAATDDYVVIAFAQDRRLRGEQSRYVRTFARFGDGDAASDRVFREGLRVPPGSYHVVALQDVAYEDLRDPEFLESLVRLATPAVLAEGDTLRLALRRR